jgi:serine/threonine-protein kinase
VSSEPQQPTRIGRYAVYDAIASGGMATVHFGRLGGPAGFARTIAIKRMHPHLAKLPEFTAMFLDEARLAARIRHPNVVSTLDVVATDEELLIVMEYVHGESLAKLTTAVAERKQRVPVPVACAIVADLLAGLHAAHEARGANGEPLSLVHRDVSPQNVIVGVDGVSRVLDFGVAKAVGRLQQTREGQVKGKIAYMAPEQVRGGTVSRSTDIYAASAVLWETLTCRRLFRAVKEADLVEKILFGTIDAPSACASGIPEKLNEVVLRGLSRDPADRYHTARDMVRALRECLRMATSSDVGDWVESVAGDALAERMAALAAIDEGGEFSKTLRDRRSSDSVGEHTREDQAAVVLPSEAIGTEASMLTDAPGVRRAPRRGRTVLAVVAAVALVALGVGIVRVFGGANATPAAGQIPNAPSPSHDLVLAPPPPPPASTPAVSTTDPAGSVAAALPSSSASSHGHTTKPSAGARVRPGCDPPFTTDADGTRHYKLQCL